MQKILLVEDDPELTKLLQLHFESKAYQFISCTTAEEAVIKIGKEKVDLIILDITLPGMNGMELCRKIRESDAGIPIMMLTSHGEESDKVLALELGADDYVTKPFGILELLARAKALLRRGNKMSLADEEQTEVHCKDLSIDLKKRKATLLQKRLDLNP